MNRAGALAILSWITALAVGIALATLVATLLSFVVDGRTWVESVGLSLSVVGSITPLMDFGGHSPGMRRGTRDPYLASMFPVFARRAGDPCPKTRVSGSAILVLAGGTLLVVGIVLV